MAIVIAVNIVVSRVAVVIVINAIAAIYIFSYHNSDSSYYVYNYS